MTEGAASFAVITGSTDGIGKEFAHQLALKGFNIILVSRTMNKLEAVADEIREKHGVTVKVLAMDFTSATENEFKILGRLVDSVRVEILEEDMDTLDAIVNVNIRATLRVTKSILPQMCRRGSGLVLNIGSFSGVVPTAYLQTYSASKAFLRTWSEALHYEVKPLGVHIECLNTYFVVSNMSKIRRASPFIPSAASYVREALKRVGRSAYSTPHPAHNWLNLAIEWCGLRDYLIKSTCAMQLDIRERALRKQKRQQ